MIIYILFNNYDDTIEGVYTESGKRAKEDELLKHAIELRDKEVARLSAEITEFKEMRQPYIDKAEALLPKELEAKQNDSGGAYKLIKKERKRLLKQAEHITFDIHKLEDKILRYQRLLKSEVINCFGRQYDWEEHYLEGE